MKEKQKKTNRRYIGKVYKSRVVMSEAVMELSANAFKLLNLIYHDLIKEETLENDRAMEILGVSRRPYFSAKDELQEKGYIRIVQVGSTKYLWYVGKASILKDSKRWDEGKRLKNDFEFAQLVLGHTLVESDTPKLKAVNSDNYGVYELEGFEQGKIEEIAF